jgi:hypothetical protein
VVISFNKKIKEEIDSKELETCFSVLKKLNHLIDNNNL